MRGIARAAKNADIECSFMAPICELPIQCFHMNNRRLLIGLSPRLLRNPPGRPGFEGKTLQYLEQSVAHWVASLGHLIVMVPTVDRSGPISSSQIDASDYADALDGLILQGGADIDPSMYGEDPSPQLGPTDVGRDMFELELLRAFISENKPVLGICRGMQLINVAYGGTLYQDLEVAGVVKSPHSTDAYDLHSHTLKIAQGSWLDSLYGTANSHSVISIHHQGIKTLGRKLAVEAYSDDGVIEAIRGTDAPFLVGVQWHPEFHPHGDTLLLPSAPLLQAFFSAALSQRGKNPA